jgi:hypothetical protein
MTVDQAAPPLAPVWEKLIDRPTLSTLFTELKSHARVISIREKGGPMQFAGEEVPDLTTVYSALLSGAVHAVQIRYAYDDEEWCDTLLQSHDGWKLLRMKQRLE